MSELDGWKGIDLDEEMESTSEDYEFTDSDGSDNVESSKKRKKKQISFDKKKVIEFVKKPIVLISACVILLICLIGGWFMSNNKSPQSSTNEVVVNKEGLSKNTYEIFTNGIRDALKGNDVKNQVAAEWREATIKYGETNDREQFQKDLVKANDTRKKALEAIPNDEYEINQYMIETLNVQRDYLNKAHGATSSEDATNIYNDWRNNVNVDRDNKYIEILVEELDKVGIPYDKTENDGKMQVTF